MVAVFLADGFEEIEALATVDMLRRAGIDVLTVGVTGQFVTGSHNITVKADVLPQNLELNNLKAVVLPGGMPGTTNLKNSGIVNSAIDYAQNNNILIAAICAAPSILGEKGILSGLNATCYPGFEEKLVGANFLNNSVVKDKNIITSRGAGTCFNFGYEIIKALKDEQTAQKIKELMICKI